MTAEQTWHLTADGRAVSEDDPSGVTLLVGIGCEVDPKAAALIEAATKAEAEEPEAEEPEETEPEETEPEAAKGKGRE